MLGVDEARLGLLMLATPLAAVAAMLAERGQIDAIERRTQAIRAQAARWQAAPPAPAAACAP